MLHMRQAHPRALLSLLAGALAVTLISLVVLLPGPVLAAGPTAGDLHATLNGKPIELDQVGRYYCHDFAYPEIRCFSAAASLEASLDVSPSSPLGAAATFTPYVTIYDGTYFFGTYSHLSNDYPALALIGWNDRIRSFVVHGAYGSFWTDWFYGGNRYGYCCNYQYGWLGSYDRTFSSIQVN